MLRNAALDTTLFRVPVVQEPQSLQGPEKRQMSLF
jgi:hypothetical protein